MALSSSSLTRRAPILGLGGSQQLKQVVHYRLALLLTRFEQFEEAVQFLHALSRDRGDSPSLIEALGLAGLALPYLPTEVPRDRHEPVLKAGRAQYCVYYLSVLLD